MVYLLDATGIRVGNEEYARDNSSYGLTTLRAGHVRIPWDGVRFRFRGKSGKEHAIALDDARLARILRRCRDLPGEELFEYVDPDRGVAKVDSDAVNTYLRDIAGIAFSTKDFRTWIGTVACMGALTGSAGDGHEAMSHVAAALQRAAEKLGNTPAVCRKSYVHPAVLDVYLRDLRMPADRGSGKRASAHGLSREERYVLRFLQHAERAAAA